MKFRNLALFTLAVIIAGCGNMGPQVQEKAEDFDFQVAMPPIEMPAIPPAPGTAPLVRVGAATQNSGVNFYVPDGKILIANPNFREDGEDGEWNPDFDDFVIEVRTPAVPSNGFEILWIINDKVVEETSLQPNSQSWVVGMRWDGAHAGDHTLRVILDPDNTVIETSEDDNTIETTFSIPD